MPTYANRVRGYGTTIFTEINQLAAHHDAVNLGQGRPDFDGPRSILEAAAEAMLSGKANQYAPGMGIMPLRQQIADHARACYGLDIDAETGVVITAGAAEGVYSAISSVVNPGDEVILLEPYFDTYLPAVEWAGGKPVFVPMRPPTWSFDVDELRRAFNSSTRAIVINTPHNPTGRVFSADELQQIAALCLEHDVIVISDEVYEHLTYEGATHTPIATLPDMFDRVLTVSSAAKTFSVTGWKVGWVMGPTELVTGVWRIHQNVTFAINHPGQYGIAHALTLGEAYYQELRQMYSHKRRILLEGLQAAGITVDYEPSGAFYIMGNFSQIFTGDDREFAKWLITEHGVACIPPSAFFSDTNKALTAQHARFSYCKNDDVLHAAVQRLAQIQK